MSRTTSWWPKPSSVRYEHFIERLQVGDDPPKFRAFGFRYETYKFFRWHFTLEDKFFLNCPSGAEWSDDAFNMLYVDKESDAEQGIENHLQSVMKPPPVVKQTVKNVSTGDEITIR